MLHCYIVRGALPSALAYFNFCHRILTPEFERLPHSTNVHDRKYKLKYLLQNFQLHHIHSLWMLVQSRAYRTCSIHIILRNNYSSFRWATQSSSARIIILFQSTSIIRTKFVSSYVVLRCKNATNPYSRVALRRNESAFTLRSWNIYFFEAFYGFDVVIQLKWLFIFFFSYYRCMRARQAIRFSRTYRAHILANILGRLVTYKPNE